VVSFTSHGAMVDVPLPGGGALHCYIPLTAMGTPPPTKAREVLKKGEIRPFVLAGLDPPRRVAELALPPAIRRAKAAKPAAPAKKARAAKAGAGDAARVVVAASAKRDIAAPAKKVPAKKASAKKASAKKAPAKKAPAKKKAAPAKKAVAGKAAKGRKAPSKKAKKAASRR